MKQLSTVILLVAGLLVAGLLVCYLTWQKTNIFGNQKSSYNDNSSAGDGLNSKSNPGQPGNAGDSQSTDPIAKISTGDDPGGGGLEPSDDDDEQAATGTAVNTGSEDTGAQVAEVDPDAPENLAPLGSGKVTVWGVVQDDNQNPVSGATLTISKYAGDGAVAVSSSDGLGKFALDIPANERYLMRVTADGFALEEIRPLILDAEKLLITLKSGYLVSGKVIDRDTKDPIQKFTITVAVAEYRMMPGNATYYDTYKAELEGEAGNNMYLKYDFNSPDGSFEISGLPPKNRMMIFVKAEGYLIKVDRLEGNKDSQGKVIKMSRGVDVAGVVIDKESDHPLGGARVKVCDVNGGEMVTIQEIVTSSSGEFVLQLPDERRGGWFKQVAVTCDGYGDKILRARSLAKDSVNEIKMEAGGSIKVTVKEESGRAIQGVLVRITNGFELTTYDMGRTDSAGTFYSKRLSPDHFRAVVFFEEEVDPAGSYAAPRVFRLHKQFNLSNGEDKEVEFVRKLGAAISGRFLINGRPQGGAIALLSRSRRWFHRGAITAQADRDGNFVLDNIEDGNYSLTLEGQDGSIRIAIDIAEGKDLSRVFDVNAIPVAGSISSSGSLPEGIIQTTWTGEEETPDGYLFYRDIMVEDNRTFNSILAPAKYNVRVRAGQKEYTLKNIVVTENKTIVLTLNTGAMGTFHVIDWRSGEDISGFWARIQPYKNQNPSGRNMQRWGRNGYLYQEFDFEKYDSYSIIIGAEDYAPFGPMEVHRAGFSTNEYEIRLETGGGMLGGVIQDENGETFSRVMLAIKYAGMDLPFSYTGLDLNGCFKFENLKAGDYVLTVHRSGYRQLNYPVSLAAGGSILDLVLVMEKE
ncbi:carboxypeptidase regulatory-like domain-containing protein [Planctomycetota bacterium]